MHNNNANVILIILLSKNVIKILFSYLLSSVDNIKRIELTNLLSMPLFHGILHSHALEQQTTHPLTYNKAARGDASTRNQQQIIYKLNNRKIKIVFHHLIIFCNNLFQHFNLLELCVNFVK